ncbi:MAG: hypothetical protein ACLQLC_00675 [Candidatus Sulfotelmatobacter sp.]
MRFAAKALFAACRPQRRLSAFFAAFFLTVSFSLAACTRQNAPSPPDAATRLKALPAADSAKYPTQPSQHWSNPYLVVRPNAVGLLSSVAPNEEQILKPEEMLDALAQLPTSAWPYGRVVAILVDEKPGASDADKIAIRRTRGIVTGDLQGANVAVHWIPTS